MASSEGKKSEHVVSALDLLTKPLPPPKLNFPGRTGDQLPSAPNSQLLPRAPRYLSDEEIQSFKKLNLSVQLFSPKIGRFWIVPGPSNAARNELSAEHVAFLISTCMAFEDAMVEEINWDGPKVDVETD